MKRTEDIAVIGWQVRFPGAGSVEEFWRNLCNGVESISFYGKAELEAAGYDRKLIESPSFVNAAPIIEDIEAFDASFFGFSPRDAEIVDPQIRIFIEQAWSALEDAGYDAERFPGAIGVFAGANISRYYLDSLKPLIEQEAHRVASTVMTLCFNDKDALATLVSYKLNLRGPAVTVQSFCSTSLVAVHLGCQSLLMGDSDMVIAGGSNLHGRNAGGYEYREGDILSPDGHCRPFDAGGRGTLFGSGAGAVVLRRLSDALADGDTIHALIKGSAVNNDGSLKAGYTAPSIEGQAQAVARALEVSGVDPGTIGFVEAHGTATEVGDPIEVAALAKAFRARTDRKQYCALGSVKSNFGHLDRAAGVSSLVKAVLAVERGHVPPTVNFKTPNPRIDFEGSPFFVNAGLIDWPGGSPRRAGVSGLGFGGTNAHVIVEQAPEVVPSGPSRSHQLLVLSARTETALAAAADNLARHLQKHPEQGLADVAHTLQRGRRAFPYRQAVVARSALEAIGALEAGGSGSLEGQEMVTARRDTLFLFPGQGAQYVGMGQGLYESESRFRACVDECSEVLRDPLGLDLRDALYPVAGASAAAAEKLKQTALTQPALFVVEYALARLLQHWGLRPAGLIGHSIGEYVAACLAGVMRLEDALALVALRGRLMQGCPPGAMLAAMADDERVRARLGGGLSLAAVNAPGLCVVAGPFAAIEAAAEAFRADGIESRRLETSHAFHSGMMDGILDAFGEAVAAVRLEPPRIPFASNLTGRPIEPGEATDPRYWVKHLRQAVRFGDGLLALAAGSPAALVEVGPGKTLAGFARRLGLEAGGRPVVATLRHPKEDAADVAVALRALGRLWVSGVEVSWDGLLEGERRLRVPLPTYPFERSSFWLQPERAQAPAPPAEKRADVAAWFTIPSWKRAGAIPSLSRLAAKLDGRPWLLLADDGPLGAGLEGALERLGRTAVRVRFAEGFRRRGDGSFELAPGSAADFEALFRAMEADGSLPGYVVHAGNAGGGSPAGNLAAALDRAFFSTLFLLQELGKRKRSGPVSIAVVSDALHDVAGEGAARPERATLLGPCRVAGREYEDLRIRNLDLPALAAEGPLDAKLIEAILAETGDGGSEPVVACRGDHRWVLSHQASPLPPAGVAELPLKQGGVYLVTGGTGGIGLVVAEHLARRHAAKLVLTSRSGLPEAGEWARWLATHPADDAVSRRIRKVQQVAAHGEVVVLKADVADEHAMRAAIEEAEGRFGRLDGVFHAAGVPGGGVIQLKKPEVARRVLAPKVAGTLVLDRLLRGKAPAFVVLFSSAAAVGGPFGQVDYCAANAFLDAFAEQRSAQEGTRGREGTLWTSIDWDDWAEVGMAVETSFRLGVENSGVLAAQVEELAHPLFSRRERRGGEVSYLARLPEAGGWLLPEHVLFGMPTVPGSAYLEYARAAHECETGSFQCELKDLFLERPLVVPAGEAREMAVVLRGGDGGYDLRIESRDPAAPGPAQEHVRGRLLPFAGSRRRHDLEELAASCQEHEIDGPFIQEQRRANPDPALQVGPRWANARRVCYGRRKVLGFHELAAEFQGDVETFRLHPAFTDFTALYPMYRTAIKAQYVPVSYTSVRVSGPLPPRVYSCVDVKDDNEKTPVAMRFDCRFLDEDGRELLEIGDLTLHRMDGLARPAAPVEGNFSVAIATPGVLETLQVRPAARRAPAAGEVEIQVAAAGLNFRDVLRALGMLSEEHDPGAAIVGFGAECAGKVSAVGEGVTDLTVGQDVLAFAARSFGGYVTTSARAVAPIPEGLGFVEAASIPMVFLTAHHALAGLARLARGERVLIHAAAGGVGLAAVQVARAAGAEIFATAGSAAKRDYLASLGIRHVSSSRSLEFAEDVRRWTSGEGVDVVLNSLAGEFIPAGLALLRTGGRFVEIGARDIYQNAPLGLRPFAKGLSFSAFDLGQLAAARPDLLRSLLLEVLEGFRGGGFHPLPTEVYAAGEAAAAFQHMAAARHIGKIVISFADLPREDRPRAVGVPAALAGRPAASPGGRDLGHAILPEEGMDALMRILAARVPHVVVTTRSLDSLVGGGAAAAGEGAPAPVAPARPPRAQRLHPRPALTTPYTAPATPEEEALAALWRDLLGLEKVGVHDNFFELGGDSLLGIQLVSLVKAQHPRSADAITPASLYEGPTIAELARKLGGGATEAVATDGGLSAEERRARRERRRGRSGA